jgi:hypothetical protein
VKSDIYASSNLAGRGVPTILTAALAQTSSDGLSQCREPVSYTWGCVAYDAGWCVPCRARRRRDDILWRTLSFLPLRAPRDGISSTQYLKKKARLAVGWPRGRERRQPSRCRRHLCGNPVQPEEDWAWRPSVRKTRDWDELVTSQLFAICVMRARAPDAFCHRSPIGRPLVPALRIVASAFRSESPTANVGAASLAKSKRRTMICWPGGTVRGMNWL